MSDDVKSPFSEDTVVHPADAKTVIRPSGTTTTNEHAKAMPSTHFEAMPVVDHSMKDEKTEGAIQLPPRRSSRNRSSRPQGPNLRLIVGGVVTVAVAAIFYFVSKGSLHAASVAEKTEQTTDMASTAPPPVGQKFKFPETTKSTDVLAKFEQANARAQQRAFDASAK